MISIGKVVACKYRVDSLIGTGGMANVYKAYTLSGHKPVAIKVLKEEYEGDAEFVRRFRREAQAVLTLSHENIVRSYDVGEEDGSHYIVLEYVPGMTLKEIIKKDGPIQTRAAVNIACQLLEALEHAHECGIIHRDMKPQNVLVTSRGKAKLADFGIARDARASTMTFAGTNVIGSVHYISPEQARGEAVSAESDIYSMGITLYEMLTGQLPFAGDNTVSIAIKHLQEEMTPPIALKPDLPPALNDVVVKATAKQPSQRYHSAKAMRKDLLRALREPNGKFARTQPETQTTHKKAKPRKKSISGVVKIGIICIIALGLFLTMFLTVRSLWERDRAAEKELVPKLIGKTVEEARQTAELRGYVLEVGDWIASDTVPSGQIIEQSPAAGSNGKRGDTVMVNVSSGSLGTLVPDLSGMMISEAEQALSAEGLIVGAVEYTASELVTPGLICKQFPIANTEVVEGDTVDIWISGSAEKTDEMPNLINAQIWDALEVLKERGFTHILIRPEQPIDDARENCVLKQSPSSGMNADRTSTVELSVCDFIPGAYAADIVFNVDVEENDTNVMVTMVMGEGVEYILYESVLSKGTQVPVCFQSTLDMEGNKDIIVYLNGMEVRRGTANFEYRG